MSFFFKAEYDIALKYNFESLVISEAERDIKEISNTLNNIGLIHYKLKDYERSIDYYKKSLELKRQVNDRYNIDRLLINIGLSYISSGGYLEAKKYIKEGLLECEGHCSDQVILEGEFGLGFSLFETNAITESLKHFETSYNVAKKTGNSRFQAENMLYFSKIYLARKEYNLIEGYLKEAEDISKHKGYSLLLIRAYELFFTLYKSTNNVQKTIFYQSKYITLKDSIFSDRLISNLAKVQTAYEERENLKTIAEKNQVVTLQKEVIVRQQRQNLFIIAITCLVVALALALYFFIRQQQKANYKISQAKLMIEAQNTKLANYNLELEERVAVRTKDLISTNKALEQVNGDLDNFIYKTSHDIRGPLATLKGMCIISLMDIKDDLTLTYLQKMDATADRMNTILTRLMIVNHINGTVLAPAPIDCKEVLDELFAFERKKGIPPRFSLTYEIEPGCSVISDLALVRIVLENLIDNTIKFYNNSDRFDPFGKVCISKEKENIRVTVEDNGIGIESKEGKEVFQMFMRASERSEIGGLGLYLSKLATEKIGGEIQLVRSDGKGSLFEVVFPADLNLVINNRMITAQNLVELIKNQPDPNAKPSSTVI